MSVYGRVVFKLAVLGSQERKNRARQQNALRLPQR